MNIIDLIEGTHSQGTHSQGTYVGARFSSKSNNELVQLIEKLNVPNPVTSDALHVTIMYSTKGLPEIVDDYGTERKLNPPMIINPIKFDFFKSRGNTNVLIVILESPELKERHKDIMNDYAAIYPHSEYIPHVTLSYNCGEFDISELNINNYIGNLELALEYIEPLNIQFKSY